MVTEVGDGRRRTLLGAVVIWPRRTSCGSGRAGRKKEKKICRRERGTNSVCFAVGDELRRSIVVETVRASVMTVAKAMTEMVVGGRGSKRRRRKREGLQRGERN